METEQKCQADSENGNGGGGSIPENDNVVEMKNPEVEALKEALEKAKADVLYQRADFENSRKRLIKEQDQAIKFANEKIILEVAGIVDLLGRALSHSGSLKTRTDDKEVTNFLMGIELTQKEFISLLGRFGVEFFGSKGEVFNPAKHEAMSQLDAASAEQDETIAEVVAQGALLNGRLLKPAQVIVFKASAK